MPPAIITQFQRPEKIWSCAPAQTMTIANTRGDDGEPQCNNRWVNQNESRTDPLSNAHEYFEVRVMMLKDVRERINISAK